MKTIKGGNYLSGATLLCCILMIIAFGCSSDSSSLKTVKQFVKEHPEYGGVNSSKEMPDWDSGKRLQINTNNGEYLFYLKGEEVVGVDKCLENGQREKVFNKETPLSQTESSVDESLPVYKVLFQVELASGVGKFGEVLISSYSKEISREERERTLRKIMEKEGFVSAALYSTEAAYKANSSESFSKANPDALKDGYLGQITEEGVFVE